MNLFEMLDTYQTNPVKEIKKIKSILNREGYVNYHHYFLKDAFDLTYSSTSFASHEPTFDDFLKNIVFEGYNQEDVNCAIKSYRYLCEFLLALIDSGINYAFEETFGDDIAQLQKIINAGLERSGYTLVKHGKYKVTSKKDEQAEATAAIHKEYQKNILDYLLAKAVDEKEKVLTSLSIQLDGHKPSDSYSKDCREWVQLLRHKEEKIVDSKYSWFFDNDDYEKNLDKLFRIYLSIISHDDCHDYLEEFKSKRGVKA